MEIIKCGECGGELFADPALKAELETAQHLEIENGILKKYKGDRSYVVIPCSVTEIAADAIPHNPGLQIRLCQDHPVFYMAGSCLIHKQEKKLVFGSDIQDLPADGSVTAIGAYAFAGCELPESLELPACISSIGENAFGGCPNPAAVTFYGRTLEIGDNAFGSNPGNLTIYAFEESDIAQWAGRNNITTLENKEMRRISVGSLLEQGGAALQSGNWEQAAVCFGKLQNKRSPNARAFVGMALAQEHCHTLEELVSKRVDAYREVSPDPQYINEKTVHIKKMVEKYSVPGYVDASAIRELYAFDLSYPSEVSARRKQCKEAVNWWKNHPQLSSAEKFARESLAEYLKQERESLLAQLMQRVEEAQKVDAQAIAVRKAAYDAHIAQADEQAEKLYNDNVPLREQDYEIWLKQMKGETDLQKLSSLAEQFSRLGDYRDSKTLAEQCFSRIQKAQEKAAAEEERRRAAAAEAERRRAAAEEAERRRAAAAEEKRQRALAAEEARQRAAAEKEERRRAAAAEEERRRVAAAEEKRQRAAAAEEERQRAAAAKEEHRRAAAEEKDRRRAAAAEKKKTRRKRLRPIAWLAAIVTAVCLVVASPAPQLIADAAPGVANAAHEVIESAPALQYLNARILAAKRQYKAAAADFDALGDYKDAAARGDEAGYLWAEELFAEERYEEALAAYEQRHPYGDSAQRIAVCKDRIELLKLAELEAAGKYRQAALIYYNRGEREKSLELWNVSADRETVSVGYYHTVALRNDGTVAVAGSNWDDKKWIIFTNGQCDVGQWKDIVDIEAGDYHTVGLKADGTVVATGLNTMGQCDVSDWTDIVAVAAGHGYSAGLRADGTVRVAGDGKIVSASEWTDIIALAGGDEYIIGLRADGTTTSTRPNAIASRENVTKIAAGVAYGFLHEDGVVSSPYGAVSGLKNIEDIFAGSDAVICRGVDGSLSLNLIARGAKERKEFRNWIELESKDIVAFSADNYHSVVLHADGTVAALGRNEGGRCNVANWRNIKVPQKPLVIFAPEDAQSESAEENIDFAAEYQSAEKLLELGKTAEAAIAFGKLDGYKDARERSLDLWNHVAVRKTVAVGEHHTLAVKNDGTVLAAGKTTGNNPCNVGDWTDVVAVAATSGASYGLKSDGTVISTDAVDNALTRSNDIVAISDNCTFGLKMDGTVVSTAAHYDVSDWTDVMAVYFIPGKFPTASVVAGIKTDGTFVVATPKFVVDYTSVPDLGSWKDIVAFGAGKDNYGSVVVGLKANGRAVATGYNRQGQAGVGGWNNIVEVAVCGDTCTLGVTKNGNVVMAGKFPDGYSTNGWTDIVSIATSKFHAVGLKADGTLVATGYPSYGRCDVSEWSDIRLPNDYLAHAVPSAYKPIELTEDAAAYQEAKKLMDAGETAKAALAFGKLGDYMGARDLSLSQWDALGNKQTISAGRVRTMAVQSNGNVLTTDGSRLGGGIVAVSDGNWHYMGLRANGTVDARTTNNLMAGLDSGTLYTNGKRTQPKNVVGTWKNLQAVSAGDAHTVGLYTDGTAVAIGDNHFGRCAVEDWKDLIAVSAGYDHTVGLKADGTVLSTGGNKNGLPDTTQWRSIKAISAGQYFTVGLKRNGTVIAAGNNEFGQCDVYSWQDVVAVSAGNTHTVALLADGTVVATGGNEYGQCNVTGWHDIVAIDAGSWHTVGLRSDGTLLAVGLSSEGRCDVGSWKNIKLPK